MKCELRGRVVSDGRNQGEDSNSLQGTVASVLLVQREKKSNARAHTHKDAAIRHQNRPMHLFSSERMTHRLKGSQQGYKEDDDGGVDDEGDKGDDKNKS